jgi:hypothetical protein
VSVVRLWQVVWHQRGSDTSLTPVDRQRSGMGMCARTHVQVARGGAVHARVRGYPRGRDEVEPREPKHKLPMVELFAGDLPA